MPLSLPRRFWLLVCWFGVLIAVVFAIVPVAVDFGHDPLLRLRQLDPELTPRKTTAVCGSPITHLNPKPKAPSLDEVARSRACDRAAHRHLFGAIAAGAIVVMVGLLGLSGLRPEMPSDTRGSEKA